jgi:hypothetical protein
MFLLLMIMYLLIELELMRKLNFKSVLLSEKQRQIFGQIESENSLTFSLPSFKIYSINFSD